MKGLLFLLAVIVLPCVVQAQSVMVYASVDSVRVGSYFELTIIARHGIMTEALLPDTGRAFGGADLAVFERLQTGTAFGGSAAPGTRVDSAVYRVAAFALDTLVVPPIAVGFVQGTDTLLVPSAPFRLPMIATAPADADALRPARDPLDFPLPFWVWALVVLTVLALAFAVWFLLRRLRKKPQQARSTAPVQTPTARVLARLHALEGTDLSAPEHVKPYYVELTEALRQFVEDTTPIPALELTSGDLLRRVRQETATGALPPDLSEHLAEIFPVADFAKFADGLPAPAEGEIARRRALAAVDSLEAHRQARLTPAPEPQP